MSEKKNYYALHKSLKSFDSEISHICDKSPWRETNASSDSGSHVVSTAELNESSPMKSEQSYDFEGTKADSIIVSPNNIALSESDQSISSKSGISTHQSYSMPMSKPEFSLSHSLNKWYNDHNISHSALKSLLGILKPYHSELPLDPRTLLGTKSVEIEANANGHFAYFGLEENIIKYCHIDDTVDTGTSVIKLDINIDGVPVFKSRNTSFWPILCSSSNSKATKYPQNTSPFIVGIFYGKNKPEINHYLDKFISELDHLLKNEIPIGIKHFDVEIRAIIADAPARSYLKQIKTHGGYYACDRCTVKGVYKNNSVSYEILNCTKRTDESFRNKAQPEHHIGTSPFASLSIDLIQTFTYDYMHLILLGIVKKLIGLFLKKLPYKLSTTQKNSVETKIKIAAKYCPCDFNRKPRSFSEFDRFKATEFRTLILYTGIFIFKEVLSKEVYEHFLMLMFITRILCDEAHVSDQNILNYVQKLCLSFVRKLKKIFSTVNISYNLHSLIHIVEDVKIFGTLDTFSSFPYESSLGNIKRKIRSSNDPLAQISRRISEGYTLCCINPIDSTASPQLLLGNHKIIPNQIKNSCIILKDKSVVSIEKMEDGVFTVRKFKKLKSAYNYPLDTSILDIFIVKKTDRYDTITRDKFFRKCFIIPQGNKFLVLPLL